MMPVQPNDARVRDLVAKFTEICIAQYLAAYVIDTARYNRSYKAMQRVRAELKAKPGDQRRALLPLTGSLERDGSQHFVGHCFNI